MQNYFNFTTLPYELRKGNKVNFPETQTCRYGINLCYFVEIYYGITSSPVMLKKVILWNNLMKRLSN